MKQLLIAAALLLSACATTDPDVPAGADLTEASRINTQLGVDYMRRGEDGPALAKLTRAVEQDPTYATAHASLGFLYAKLGDATNAESSYQQALSLEPGNGDIRNNYGVFLCGQGKLGEARRMMLDALRDPNYATPEAAWTNAGACARQNKDLETAESDFREALKINAAFPPALAQLAELSYHAKNYLRARAFVQRYMETASSSATLLWIALMTERKLGDIAAAQQYEKRLKRDYPDSPEAQILKTYRR